MRRDGPYPDKPLTMAERMWQPRAAFRIGGRSVALLRIALRELDDARAEEREAAAEQVAGAAATALTPAQESARRNASNYETRLGEVRRGLIYGLDMLERMVALVEYHEVLRRTGFEGSVAPWAKVEPVANRMDAYYFPVECGWPTPGLDSPDALTRSLLRPVLRRCRRYRAMRAAIATPAPVASR